MKRERLESACVCVRKREREEPIESVDSRYKLISSNQTRGWCCEEKYVSDFLLLARGIEKSDPPKKRKKKAKRAKQ